MVRVALKSGDKISVENFEYIIDSVVGDGATCIVYSARYIDHARLCHSVLLKECYPYACNASRNGKMLLWADENEHQNILSSFKSAYEKLMDMQNTAKLRNSTSHAFDLFEANGTLYSVTDITEGTTFEKEKSKGLSDILKTVLALSKVVGKYHNAGYLHLDIKPSNFLVISETRELVVLFDMDSVTSTNDIKNGNVRCVPYSKGWAAPEQMQGQITKLCPATDIYSIGVVLFQKLFGRDVTPADTGVFADWDFEDKIFDNVNPKIKRLLRTIFQKTLSANIKRRYQSADELIVALEEAVEVADQNTYLLSDYIVSDINFVGRKNDLLKLDELFDNGTKAVFLHGFGGVGKTALATKYAELYGNKYDCIKFCRYANELKHIIDSLEIANASTGSSDEHRKLLKSVLKDNRTLIIIDNFDVEDDEELEYLLSLNCNVLFTTRNDYSQYISSEKIEIIELESLPTDALVQVFKNEYGRDITAHEEELVQDIIEKFGNLTLIVPMIAKQILSSHISIEEFASSIEDDVFARFNEDNEDIRIRKDGKSHKTNSLDYLRVIFNIAALSDEQKTVLQYLYLLRYCEDLTVTNYRDFVGVKSTSCLNDLAFRNWIKINKGNSQSEYKIIVHQLIYDLTEKDLHPNIYTCQSMLDRSINRLRITEKYAEERRADLQYKKHIEQTLNRKAATEIVRMLNSLDYNLPEDVEYIVGFFQRQFNGDIYKAQYCICDQLFEMMFSLINVWKASDNKTNYELNGIIIFLYILYCMGTEIEFRDEDDEIPQEIQDIIAIFKITIEELKISKNAEILYRFLKPYLNAVINFEISLRLDADFLCGVLESAYHCVSLLQSEGVGDSRLIADFVTYYQKHYELCNSSEQEHAEKDLDEALKELHTQPIHILMQNLEGNESDKVDAIQSVLLNDAITPEEKNNLIEFVFSNIFMPLRGQTQIKIRERDNFDWNSYIEPLIIHANYFDQNPISSKRDGGKFDLHFNISRCRLAYIFTLINDPRSIETLEQVYKQIERRHLSQLPDAWWNDKSSLPRFYVDFDRMINVFYNINKSNVILPYLVKYTDMVKENLPNSTDNIVLFEWYERTLHCAEDAYNQSKNNDYLEIIKKYKQIIQELINKKQGAL